jgi:hypothetical protein
MSAIADPSAGMLTTPDRRVHSAPGSAQRESTLTGAVPELRRMRFPFDGGECVVEIAKVTSAWVTPTVSRLANLLSMPQGWDTYGAPPVDLGCIKAAITVVLPLMYDGTPAPAVVPTSGGGVQLEWHTRGIDLEVEIRSPSRISACFEDQHTQSAWDIERLYDFGRLRDALRELARR